MAVPATDASIPIDLIRTLQKLPADLWTVILLVSINGLSHDEAADVLAIPVGTVASRLHKARKRLTINMGIFVSPPRKTCIRHDNH